MYVYDFRYDDDDDDDYYYYYYYYYAQTFSQVKNFFEGKHKKRKDKLINCVMGIYVSQWEYVQTLIDHGRKFTL